MIAILFEFIAAHLIGDFIFQTDRQAKMKFTAKMPDKLKLLGWHSAVQAGLTYLFIAQWSLWVVPAVIFITHFAIDFAKIESGKRGLIVFLLDQCAHYAVILLLWWLMFVNGGNNVGLPKLSATFWICFSSYIAVLVPASVFIKLLLEYKKWVPCDTSLQGMPDAGRWIGYLERILILSFIFSNHIEGIGFLLAAKSIFRFGELRRSKDVKVTEYVLIGTFLSFTVAILIGFGTEWLIGVNKELL